MCTDNTALSLSTTEGATFKTERKLATNIVHPEHYFQNRDFHQMVINIMYILYTLIIYPYFNVLH